MSNPKIVFEHVHIISADPESSASWYVDVLGGTMISVNEVRGATQIAITFEGATILIRGQRAGEEPSEPKKIAFFPDFASHNEWGTDHFAFTVYGDLYEYCEQLTKRGASFSVDAHEFSPGLHLAYLKAPDGVSIELLQG